MADDLACYRCGASLAALTLPLGRLDECPSCTRPLHVCRMCAYYDADVAKQCREDDADEVREKERPNFCDYFKPVGGAFTGAELTAEHKARDQLAALFGAGETSDGGDETSGGAAEDLFRQRR